MADDNKFDEIDLLQTNMIGLDRNFIEKNRGLIEASRSAVNSVFRNTSMNAAKRSFLSDISTLMSYSTQMSKDQARKRNSGALLTPDIMDLEEKSIVETFQHLTNNQYYAIPEYRNVIGLIPELKRIYKIIARDIIARDDISGKALNITYNTTNKEERAAAEAVLREIADDELDLESRINQWTFDTLTETCKPVAIIPYAEIIQQLQSLNDKFINTSGAGSSASFDSLIPSDLPKECFSGGELGMESYTGQEVPKIVTDGIVDAIFESFVQSVTPMVDHTVKTEKGETPTKEKENFTSFESIDDDLKKMRVATNPQDYKDIDSRTKIRKAAEDIAKNVLSNIQITDDKYRWMGFKKHFSAQTLDDYAKRHQDKMGSKVSGTTPTTKGPVFIDESVLGIDKKDTESAEEKVPDATDLTKLVGKLNDALVLAFAPEAVIPVIVNQETIGYYVLETEDVNSIPGMRKSQKFSYTELIKQAGYKSDGPLVRGDQFNNSIFDAQNVLMRSGMMNPDNMLGVNSRELNQNVQKLVFRTIEHRLKQKGVTEDKRFRDAIMHLIRQGYIINREVRVSYIPAVNMINYQLRRDSDGHPVSIMDGNLLIAYMYLGNVVSSYMIKLMKASDKEKVIFDVGMSKQIGSTIEEIRKNMNTKQVSAATLFQSLSTVLRNTSTFEKVYIPSVSDKLLYDIEPMQRFADINPDDNLSDKLMASMISSSSVPASMLNFLSDNEFSRSLVLSHNEYRATIGEDQTQYRKFVVGLIRRYAVLAQRTYEYEGKANFFKPELIDFNPRPPIHLTVVNTKDEMTDLKDFITSLIEFVIDPNEEQNPVTASIKQSMVKKLARKHMMTVDWSEIDEMYAQAKIEATRDLADSQVRKKAGDIVNQGGASAPGY